MSASVLTAAESTTPRLTLVTALFDLARREPGASRPTPQDYLEWGAFLFGLDCDIVFYVDPELELEIQRRRQARGLLDRTTVVPVAFESLSSHGQLEQIAAARVRHPLINGNPLKDTPLYTVLGWSKFELVRRAMTDDPFGASHFAWIDLGLAKVAVIDHAVDDGVFQRPAEHVRLLMMREPEAGELADLTHYLSHLWGHFAAGYISADVAGFTRLCELVSEEAAAALEQRYAATDEQLLALAHAREPHLFSFHYGDYRDVLGNYRYVRGSAGHLLERLRQCRRGPTWQRARARDIARQCVDGLAAGTLDCSSWRASDLLEECFVAIFFADYPREAAAREVVDLYHHLARRDPGFRDGFLRNEIRVRTNFSLLSEAGGR